MANRGGTNSSSGNQTPKPSAQANGGLSNGNAARSGETSPGIPAQGNLTNGALLAEAKTDETSGNSAGKTVLGIDLGTTFSSLATVDSTGRPQTIRSDIGELTTPSVVFFDSLQPVVGKEAVGAAEFEPGSAARFVKRHLGEDAYPERLNGLVLPPEVIQGVILKSLKETAQRKLGDLERVVVTVPAYFNETHRVATQNAGRMAGFAEVMLINEPTAAAIAYGVEAGFLDSNYQSTTNELVMVFDLGGGTFDVTIMEIEGNRFDEIATAGHGRLGGMDWDQRLMENLAKQLNLQHSINIDDNAAIRAQLLAKAEQAKRTLSYRPSATIRMEVEGREIRLEINRSEFENQTADLLKRTRSICRRLLLANGLEWSDLTQLVLVGGSTRMPAVRQMLQSESGLKLNLSLSPDEAIAHGAALFCAAQLNGNGSRSPALRDSRELGQRGNLFKSVEVTNTCAHSLGVLGRDRQNGLVRHQVMIPRQSLLPAEKKRKFYTAKLGQESVVVTIVEKNNDARGSTTRIGKCVVSELPAEMPQGSCVEVLFRYSKEGTLTVDARLPDINRKAQTTIKRVRTLDANQLRFWRNEIGAGLDLDRLSSQPDYSSQLIAANEGHTGDRLGELDENDFSWHDRRIEEEEVELELDRLLADLESFVRPDDSHRCSLPGLRDPDQKGIQDQDISEGVNASDNVALQEFLKNLETRRVN